MLVFHFKKLISMMLILAIMLCIIIFSSSSYQSAKDAFRLWANNVVPSLLPFFICIELLKHTPFIKIIGKILTPIMKPLFGVPGCGAFAISMGMTSGYPSGGKISADLYESGACSKEEAERLLSFTNTSGPLFIISACGIAMFQSSQIGMLLLITHFLASITTGIIFRNYSSSKNYKPPASFKSSIISQNSHKININHKISSDTEPLTSKNIGFYMANAIQSSISTLLLICGYMVLAAILVNILDGLHIIHFISNFFSPLLALLNIPIEIFSAILKGFIEVTNGLKNVSNLIGDEITILTSAAFILGFGGLSVLMQTASIIAKTDLSLKPYILGKFLHATLAAIYTYLILKHTNFLSSKIVSAFHYTQPENALIHESTNIITVLCFMLLLGIIIRFSRSLKRKK